MRSVQSRMRDEHLGADHQGALAPPPVRMYARRRRERVDEAGAARPARRRPRPSRRRACPAGRRRWTGSTMSRRRRCATMIRSMLARRAAGRSSARLGGLRRRGPTCASSGAGDVALADAGALDDPLVGGVDATALQVLVGQAFRHVAAGAVIREYASVRASAESCGPPSGALGVRAPAILSRIFGRARVENLDGAADGVLDGAGVGAAVADEAAAVHPEQRRGAVLGCSRCAPRKSSKAGLASDSRAWRGAARRSPARSMPPKQLGERLGALQHDVADEAVADDDVGRAVEDVAPLDVADEVEAGRP